VLSTLVRGEDWSCKVALPKDHLAAGGGGDGIRRGGGGGGDDKEPETCEHSV